jgi:hypothetical protein
VTCHFEYLAQADFLTELKNSPKRTIFGSPGRSFPVYQPGSPSPETKETVLMKKIQIPEDPAHMVTAIVAYAGIAKRLHVELSNRPENAGVDLEAIKADLIAEAKRAIPHGDFAKDEIGVYKTIFQAIDTIFDPDT